MLIRFFQKQTQSNRSDKQNNGKHSRNEQTRSYIGRNRARKSGADRATDVAGKSEQAEQDKLKAQQEAERKKISNRVKFGTSGSTGSGKAGSPNGNSSSGALTGKPGIGGLGGYTLENWSRPSSSLEGTITIQVKVNARGNVVSASYASGTGAAAGNQAARNSCIAAARQSSFSVPKNTTTDAVGTITYRFE